MQQNINNNKPNHIKKSNSFSSMKKSITHNLNLTYTVFPKKANLINKQNNNIPTKKFNSTLTEWSKNPIKMTPNSNDHNNRLSKDTNNSFNYSVPNLSLYKNNKFTKENKPRKKSLILDLDETLVHSSFYPFERASDLTLPIKVDNQKRLVYILRRPYALEFIKEMSLYYEIIIYTASIPEYASNLLDEFDKDNVISKRFYRYNCIHRDGIYIKDLRLIGRPFKDLIIIDNNPISYLYNMDNGLPILSWYGDKQDIELLKFIPLLKYLAKVDDVTEIIPQIVNRTKNKIKFSLINKMIDNDDSNLNININNNFGANHQRNYHENSIHNNKYNNAGSSNNLNLNYSFNKPSINIILNRNDNKFNNYMNANCNESSELRDSVFSPEEPSLTINEIYEERKNYNNNLNNKNDLTNEINNNEKSNYIEILNRTPINEKKNNKSYTPDLDTHKNKIQKIQENGSMTNIHRINDQKNYNYNNQKNNFYKKKNNANGNIINNNNYHNINTVKYNNNKINFTTPNNQPNNNINNNIKKYFIPIPKVIQNINEKKIENKDNNINSNFNNNKANKQNINTFNNHNINYISNSNDNEKNRIDYNNNNNNYNNNIFYRKKEIENGGYDQNNINNRSNIPNIRNNISNDNNYFVNNNKNINNNEYISNKNNLNLSNNYSNNKVDNNINLNNNSNNYRNKLNNINDINEYNNKIFDFYRRKYKVNYKTKKDSDNSDIYKKNNNQNNDYHFNSINNNYSFNNQILKKYNDFHTNDDNFYSEKLKSVNDRINEIRETLNKAEYMLKEGKKNSFSEEKIEKENIYNIINNINNKSLDSNTNNININHNKNIKYFSNNNIFDLNPEKNDDFYQNENCPSLNELINYKNYSIYQQKEEEENDIDNNNDYSKRQIYNNLNSHFFNNN